MAGQIQRGSVVSFPDLFEKHPDRSGVIVSEPHLDPEIYTVAPLTTDPQYESHPLTTTIQPDETAEGRLEKESYFEPWRTTGVKGHELDGPYARLSSSAMKRVAKSYVRMCYDGYELE